MKDFYFCLRLTENEHDIVEYDLSTECNREHCNLVYYRKLKDGHIPMYREVKISGSGASLNRVRRYVQDNLEPEPNPYKIKSEEI